MGPFLGQALDQHSISKADPDRLSPVFKVLTIFFVQLMNIGWYFSAEPVVDVDEFGPFGDLRPWDPRERTSQPAVEKMLKRKLVREAHIIS